MFVVRKKEEDSNRWHYITRCEFRGEPILSSIKWESSPDRVQMFFEKCSFKFLQKNWPNNSLEMVALSEMV